MDKKPSLKEKLDERRLQQDRLSLAQNPVMKDRIEKQLLQKTVDESQMEQVQLANQSNLSIDSKNEMKAIDLISPQNRVNSMPEPDNFVSSPKNSQKSPTMRDKNIKIESLDINFVDSKQKNETQEFLTQVAKKQSIISLVDQQRLSHMFVQQTPRGREDILLSPLKFIMPVRMYSIKRDNEYIQSFESNNLNQIVKSEQEYTSHNNSIESVRVSPLAKGDDYFNSIIEDQVQEDDNKDQRDNNLTNDPNRNFENLVDLLQKPCCDRKDSDLMLIKTYLKTKQLQLFKQNDKLAEYGEDTINQMIKAFRYQFLEGNQFLFQYGDKASTLYIIIKGSVDVRVPQDIQIEMHPSEYEEFVTKNEKYIIDESPNNDQIMNDYFYYLNHPKPAKPQNQKEPTNKYSALKIQTQPYKTQTFSFRFQQYVTTLRQGNSFGELALMYGKNRSATIETAEDTHFVTLEKKDYKKVLMEADEKKMTEELKYIRQFAILGQMTRITLHKLYLEINIMKFKRGQLVYKEGDPMTHMYLIKIGDFEQSKILRYVVQKEQGLKVLNKYFTQQKIEQPKSSIASLPIKQKKFQLALIGDFDICCLEEYFLQSKTYLSSLECKSSEGVVYQVKLEFFKKIKSDEVTKLLNHMSQDKIEFLNKRLIQIARAFKRRYKLERKSSPGKKQDSDDSEEEEQEILQNQEIKAKSQLHKTLSPKQSRGEDQKMLSQFNSIKSSAASQASNARGFNLNPQNQILTNFSTFDNRPPNRQQNSQVYVDDQAKNQQQSQIKSPLSSQTHFLETQKQTEVKIKDADLEKMDKDMLKQAKAEWGFGNRVGFYRNLLAKQLNPIRTQPFTKLRLSSQNSESQIKSSRNFDLSKQNSQQSDHNVMLSKITFPFFEGAQTTRQPQNKLPFIVPRNQQITRQPVIKQKQQSPVSQKNLYIQQKQLQVVLNTISLGQLPPQPEQQSILQGSVQPKTARVQQKILVKFQNDIIHSQIQQSRAQTPSSLSVTKSSRFSAQTNQNYFALNRAALYTDTLGTTPFNKDLNIIYKSGKKSSMNILEKNEVEMDKLMRDSMEKRRQSMHRKPLNNDELAIEGETIERF
ncbi:UNKNOWN [Stylonychia lemnae]|uniref:Cyclic nucleotide-binding domain-containing protein n=1 Tax=Stylonychia lemnae TaxID=5949 RepID=A0A078AG94_STYLE|nr:UNKNOWN [Stylonychia lemnae]|eukprot:CDW81320.1 UNKNOWN [Stylonychia lemnae]